MKKFLSIILLLFSFSIFAQEIQEIEKATSNKKMTPVFWKIEAEKPVYLLGTMHMGVDASSEFHEGVWEKLKECKTLVLELDMTKINQFEMIQKIQLPPGKSLDQMLGEEHWEKLGKFIAPYPAMAFKNFKPWALQSIFAQKFLPPTPAVEMTLTQKAIANGITIEALETVDEQLDAMDKVPEEDMIKSITQVLDDIPAAKKEAQKLLEAYKNADLEVLEEMMFKSKEAKDSPEMIEHVIVNRNKNWIPKIEEYIKTGNVFIAVGAGHFVSKEGLISLLEQKGYKITRIKFSNK